MSVVTKAGRRGIIKGGGTRYAGVIPSRLENWGLFKSFSGTRGCLVLGLNGVSSLEGQVNYFGHPRRQPRENAICTSVSEWVSVLRLFSLQIASSTS